MKQYYNPPEPHPRVDVDAYLARVRELVDAHLDWLVPAETAEPVEVHEAMRWILFAGGKRLRPALVIAVGESCGVPVEHSLTTACAYELLHTYSLIHDDLPAMDDDDMRRGRATCHVEFGEATAILAGDALQALAFQVIAEDETLKNPVRVRLIAELARAAGTPVGMVAGQAFDLAAEDYEVDGAELDMIHLHKTGALITAAARAGAHIAYANRTRLAALTKYATHLGLLFQITDDLLDVTATAADLGKTPGKDARARKATYPALYGLEATRERARSVYMKALLALDATAHPTPLLRALARFIHDRQA
jgi:geranylgeranyl diphosphate synthase, type II